MNRIIIASKDRESLIQIKEVLSGVCQAANEPGTTIDAYSYSRFDDLKRVLDDIPSDLLRHLIVVLDPTADKQFWLCDRLDQTHGVGVQLVLAFPDVYFVFWGGPRLRWTTGRLGSGYHTVTGSIVRHHFVSGSSKHKHFEAIFRAKTAGFTPLFDPTGLRSRLKLLIDRIGAPSTGDAHSYRTTHLSRLRCQAAVVDEEQIFVALNGYSCYRAGCGVWQVTTKAEQSRILPESLSARTNGPRTFQIVVSDWDLQFPDQHERPKQSHLMNSELRTAEPTIVVTGVPREVNQEAKDHLWIRRGHEPRIIEKPLQGIYSPFDGSCESYISELQIRSERLLTPPARTPTVDRIALSALGAVSAPTQTHSAPSSSFLVDSIMGRARTLAAKNSSEAFDWLVVAVLCSEAKEILAGMSRHRSNEAVALQHMAEARAETSQFIAAADLSTSVRWRFLENEILKSQPIGDEGNSRNLDRQSQHVALQVINALRQIYSSSEQVGSAEDALRVYSSTEHFVGNSLTKRLEFIFTKYLDRTTDSGTSVIRLLWSNVIVVVCFALLYCCILMCHTSMDLVTSFGTGLAHSAFTFVQLSPGPPSFDDFSKREVFNVPPRPFYQAVLFLEICFAYLHLGVLLSILYRKLTRHSP